MRRADIPEVARSIPKPTRASTAHHARTGEHRQIGCSPLLLTRADFGSGGKGKTLLRITMEGGTTYIFIVNGIEAALSQAKAAAGQRNVAIMGGANTINQYLSAGLLDELWLHIVPVTCGAGAHLFENVPNLQLEPLEISGTPLVTHIRYRVVKK